jgi:hypothetical protein
MRQAARDYALTASWDSVFEGVYQGYETLVPESAKVSPAHSEVP